MTTQKSHIAVIGLGVMGQNLARNLGNQHFHVLVYNRHTEKAKAFINKHGNEYLNYSKTLKDLVDHLAKPRKILLMVPAGEPVDEVIGQLTPLLTKGDMIIDGGNSYYCDTIRRTQELEKKGIHFVGMGISGGEEGALHGPSLMPGGSVEAWKILSPMLQKIAAKDFEENPCVTHIGSDGAGHYVKMIHNGIEYAIMQMMAETYDMFKNLYNLPANDIADIFESYKKGKLSSFLFEIAVPVLKQKDEMTGQGYLIDKILDKAGQKGTGTWSAIEALQRGGMLSMVMTAVQARSFSSRKEDRIRFDQAFRPKIPRPSIDLKKMIPLFQDALYAGMICAYAEGLDLIALTAKEEGWKVHFDEIIRIWQGGCIIRAELLKVLYNAYLERSGESSHLFTLLAVQELLKNHMPALRFTTSIGLASGIPLPTMSAAANYFSSMTHANLPANFIQGLRDYFGAHTYERIDIKGTFHTQWVNPSDLGK